MNPRDLQGFGPVGTNQPATPMDDERALAVLVRDRFARTAEYDEAFVYLRHRLAQPDQSEPVGTVMRRGVGAYGEPTVHVGWHRGLPTIGTPLYTHPDRTQAPGESGEAEFEVHAGGEYFATVNGPREDAWREAMHYVAQLDPSDGEPAVFEVVRSLVAAAPTPPSVP